MGLTYIAEQRNMCYLDDEIRVITVNVDTGVRSKMSLRFFRKEFIFIWIDPVTIPGKYK